MGSSDSFYLSGGPAWLLSLHNLPFVAWKVWIAQLEKLYNLLGLRWGDGHENPSSWAGRDVFEVDRL